MMGGAATPGATTPRSAGAGENEMLAQLMAEITKLKSELGEH
jgi:hypothetical protein